MKVISAVQETEGRKQEKKDRIYREEKVSPWSKGDTSQRREDTAKKGKKGKQNS